MTESKVDASLFANYVPLNALRPESQADLARKSVVSTARAGDSLFKLGDSADRALFLMSGALQLKDGDGKVVSTIRAGEPSAMHRIAHQSPRRVTAQCATDVRYLAIDAGLLDVMLTWDQTGSFEVGELVAGETETGGDEDWMTRLLQMRTFQLVPPSNLQAMFMRMQEVQVEPGQVIVRQNDAGDYFYVVMSGRFIVTREQPNQKPVRLAELETGACFGEEALISETRRNATVTALVRGKLMRLSKDDFRTLLNDPLQNAPYDQAVVDQHHANRARRRYVGFDPGISQRRLGQRHVRAQATPTSCKFPSSVSRSTGFMTYSSAPASIAARIWSMLFSVVQKTTRGRSSIPKSRSLKAPRNSIPLITGMFQSSRITSGRLARQKVSASCPSAASSTEKDMLSRICRATLRMTLLSSTTRQDFDIKLTPRPPGNIAMLRRRRVQHVNRRPESCRL